MPSPIIHLQLAYELSQYLSIELSPDFIRGVISPDAIHTVEGSTWQDKSVTHYYHIADEDYEKAITTAYLQTCNAGYCFHLYTDYLWREYIYTPFFQLYKDKMPRPDLHALYYHDMVLIDQYYLQKADWIQNMKYLLGVGDSYPMSTLSVNNIKDWSMKVSEQDLSNQTVCFQVEQLKVFTVHQIDGFLEKYLPIMIEVLTKLDIPLY